MKSNIFPFLPMPIEAAENISRRFDFFSNILFKVNPNIKKELNQADIEIEPRRYFSVSLMSAFLVFLSAFAVILVIGLQIKTIFEVLPSAFLFSFAVAVIILFYYITYPKLVIMRKNKMIDRDLLFALRYITIRLHSGIPLYDAMVSVAQGDYGLVSDEFKKTIKEISNGVSETKALEDMAIRNPSEFFRRTIWQIANNMRSGADVGSTLESITKNLVEEHKILVRRYGSELNPLILLYMMFSVIIPALSITVLVVMSSFSGVKVPVILFYIIPIAVFLLQIFFISVIKNKRPMLTI
ncbi:MAG: type II secretion system F family protein [Candidatus Nanoarchaeia archaeon]|nr:type II secretion system F family protein [Candidatus Nanoarchaeia archaeon]MDD5239348.1 type II secretion system F family protein [Candidatus Nanoarchaeia archaeon]